MATFLLAWNPKKWEWKDKEFTKQVVSVARTGSAEDRWSCGNRSDLPPSSRFFLIRLGTEPKGIVGSGRTISQPALGPHWDPALNRQGKKARYVSVRFDFLSRLPLITWEELQEPPYARISWGIQASGVLVPEPVAEKLEQIWRRRTLGSDPIFPEELSPEGVYAEGARKTVTLNAYERSPQVRAACIAHFGSRCSVCNLLLEDQYGSIAAGYIHVHHVVPLSKVGREYRVNPEKDLRPVCPNCHAIIHRRDPPLSVADVRRLLRTR